MTGLRNPRDGLWDIPIPLPHPHPTPTKTLNNNFTALPTNKGGLYNVTVNCKKPPMKRVKWKEPPAPDNVTDEFLSEMNALIDDNRDFYEIAQQCKRDRKEVINVIIQKDKTKKELAQYLHASLFSPTLSTLVKAINNNHLTTWPGLTQALVERHLPISEATIKGHIAEEKKGLQSTVRRKHNTTHSQQTPPTPPSQLQPTPAWKLMEEDMFPPTEIKNEKTGNVAFHLHDNSSAHHKGFIDLTGRLPYKSERGYEYLLVGYNYDANAILVEPLKNKQAKTITEGWIRLNQRCKQAGVEPRTYILDNETSKMLEHAFTKAEINWQYVPAYSHRANQAERAIHTFKNHFKTGLATCDPHFPSDQWDLLLHQAEMTLNMLRSARCNPKLSAYAYLNGEFDFNATPLAPPGTKCVVQLKKGQKKTWEMNGEMAYYVGPAMKHYRCVTCFYPRTKFTRATNTVKFLPHQVPLPEVTMIDFLKQTASDIVDLLKDPPSSYAVSLQAGSAVKNAYQQIAELLNRINKPEQIPPPSSIDNPATTPRVPSPVISDPSTIATVPRVQQSTSLDDPSTIAAVTRVKQNNTLLDEKINMAIQRLKKKFEPTNKALISTSQQPTTYTDFKNLAVNQLFLVNHVYDTTGKRLNIEQLMRGEGEQSGKIWTQGLSNELGRLAQGNDNNVVPTDCIDFIHHHEVPQGRKVTYANFVCDFRPLKSEPYRVRLVVGGDKLVYLADSGAPAASMLETKLMVNSVISDAHLGARFLSADLKDFFLSSFMPEPEYMKIPWRLIPADIRTRYDLAEKLHNDYIYVRIRRGMYGLKQAAILAYQQLVTHLQPYGYVPVKGTTGIFKHLTKQTTFCLCVDDFGIKYFSKEDIDHLLNALRDKYSVTVDWEGKHYCGYTFDWHYNEGYVDVSMPGYVERALQRLKHPIPTKFQFSPHEHTATKYTTPGERQYTKDDDTSPLLSKTETTWVQNVTGTFLYYGRALDYAILPALNEIGLQQHMPTEIIRKKCNRLMDYLHTYKNAFIRYKASDMQLHIDSDAAYLVLPHSRSRIAGFYHLTNLPHDSDRYFRNGGVLVECSRIRHVVASSAEAETAGLFHNAQTAIPIRTTLEALGHKQQTTPIRADNSTASCFVNNNIQIKKAKTWDMRYHWLRDREAQDQFKIYWKRGEYNDADYFTKHHAITHHRTKRGDYLHDKKE